MVNNSIFKLENFHVLEEDICVYFLALHLLAHADSKYRDEENEYIQKELHKYKNIRANITNYVKSKLSDRANATQFLKEYISKAANRAYRDLLTRKLKELAIVDNEYVDQEESFITDVDSIFREETNTKDVIEIMNNCLSKVRKGTGFTMIQFPELVAIEKTHGEITYDLNGSKYLDSNKIEEKYASFNDEEKKVMQKVVALTRYRYVGRLGISKSEYCALRAYYLNQKNCISEMLSADKKYSSKSLMFFVFICELMYWEYGVDDRKFWETVKTVFGDFNVSQQDKVGSLLQRTAKENMFKWDDSSGAGKYTSQILSNIGVPRELLKSLLQELERVVGSVSYRNISEEDLIGQFSLKKIQSYLRDSGSVRNLVDKYHKYSVNKDLNVFDNTIFSRKGFDDLSRILDELAISAKRARETRMQEQKIVFNYSNSSMCDYDNGYYSIINSCKERFGEDVDFIILKSKSDYAEFLISSLDKDLEVDCESFYIITKANVEITNCKVHIDETINWIDYNIRYISVDCDTPLRVIGEVEYKVSFFNKSDHRPRFVGSIPCFRVSDKVPKFNRIPMIYTGNETIQSVVVDGVDVSESLERKGDLIYSFNLCSELNSVKSVSVTFADYKIECTVIPERFTKFSEAEIVTNGETSSNPVSLSEIVFNINSDAYPNQNVNFWSYDSNICFTYSTNHRGEFELGRYERIEWRALMIKEFAKVYYSFASQTGVLHVKQ